MNTDLLVFISGIKEKTGINVSCYDNRGAYICGDEKGDISFPQDIEIFSDKENNRTVFSVKIKSKIIYCAIAGYGEAEKNYAIFISEFAKGFFSKTEFNKIDFIRAIINEELEENQIIRYAEQLNIPEKPCFLMNINLRGGNVKDVKNVITAYSQTKTDIVCEINKKQCVIIKFYNEFEEEYRSASEYAEFLVRSVFEETGISVNLTIGGVVENIAGLIRSYNQAKSASEMISDIKTGGEVHSFKEYVIEQILNELTKESQKSYLNILMDTGAKEIFSDDEIVFTAIGFIENDLNVSETSRKLFLHRNTLMYRLDKIEKITGLNIRKFSDALTFKLIAILIKSVK